MRRKALDRDYLGYMTMMICYELGKDEADIKHWSIGDLARWMAFFNLKHKAEKKAYEQATKGKGKGSNSPNTKVEVY
jgi:hypothetical protein